MGDEKLFRFHWKTGPTFEARGTTPMEALENAGYSPLSAPAQIAHCEVIPEVNENVD